MQQTTVDIDVILCGSCNGKGTIEQKDLTDYHRREYRYWNIVCDECKGNGRMLETVTVTTKLEPYSNAEVTLLLLKDANDK